MAMFIEEISAQFNPYTPSNDCEYQAYVPPDLDIDRSRSLSNTVPHYNQHIVISTGKSDWESRIENEAGGDNMAKVLKEMTKRKGEQHDVCAKPTPIAMISNSSFPTDPSPQPHDHLYEHNGNRASTSFLLFPHFLRFPHILNTQAHHNHLLNAYLNPMDDIESSPSPPGFAQPSRITRPVILICSHGSRDRRCGILGPLLYHEFETDAQRKGIEIEVATISHVGGHAFAGNIIVYVPPDYRMDDEHSKEREGNISPIAGMGIWYGRVEPRHVQGILDKTIKKGNILGELWRGALAS
ncbi:MAG: hypothetical protein Q9192_001927 [Flavoplaca navasiana]